MLENFFDFDCFIFSIRNINLVFDQNMCYQLVKLNKGFWKALLYLLLCLLSRYKLADKGLDFILMELQIFLKVVPTDGFIDQFIVNHLVS